MIPLVLLVDKYNLVVKNSNPNFVIDTSVVVIRDALAHGRIAGQAPSFPLSLLKFGKPNKKMVQILTKAVMDLAWFKDNLTLVHEQINKVVDASNSLGMKNIKLV